MYFNLSGSWITFGVIRYKVGAGVHLPLLCILRASMSLSLSHTEASLVQEEAVEEETKSVCSHVFH